MVGHLLLRGMLVGIVAGLLCFCFFKVFGEPQVDQAIAFETRMDEAKAQADAAKGMTTPEEPELFSRPVQAGLGLLTGVTVYSAAFGGLFALVFALSHGRMGDLGPRATAVLLAATGLVAVYVVPNLKYPANPPSVGQPDTIGMRTGLYFAIIAVSLATAIAAFMVRRGLVGRLGGWNAALVAVFGYLAVMAVVAFVLPGVNEVPSEFPATVLWQFRIASLGAQVLMWAIIGLLFGALAERTVAEPGPARNGAVRAGP